MVRDRDEFAFDFPRTEENKELFASRIDWEQEEKRLIKEDAEKSNENGTKSSGN